MGDVIPGRMCKKNCMYLYILILLYILIYIKYIFITGGTSQGERAIMWIPSIVSALVPALTSLSDGVLRECAEVSPFLLKMLLVMVLHHSNRNPN